MRKNKTEDIIQLVEVKYTAGGVLYACMGFLTHDSAEVIRVAATRGIHGYLDEVSIPKRDIQKVNYLHLR